jgi:hypothetical protein
VSQTRGKEQAAPQAITKKPYNRPHLQAYGNLQEITQTLAAPVAGALDGSGLNPNHHLTH